MIRRNQYSWQCRDRVIELGTRTCVMGILNVTPDSFSDGGSYGNISAAVERALEMQQQGADLIDIGGESTRPGAERVAAADEIRRVVPVINSIREHSDIPISIDTMKAETAHRALEAGADIVNDVSAFEGDKMMAETAVEYSAGVVLMHMKGTPRTMQDNPEYGDVSAEVCAHLSERVKAALSAGVKKGQIVVDPGIGFGKSLEHNLELMRRLPELCEMDLPILIGASRKRFIGELTQRDLPQDRKAGSLGAAAWSMLHGCHILRVHDVQDTCDCVRILDRLICGDH